MTGDQVFVEWLGNFADVKGDGRICKAVSFQTLVIILRNGMITMLLFLDALKVMNILSN